HRAISLEGRPHSARTFREELARRGFRQRVHRVLVLMSYIQTLSARRKERRTGKVSEEIVDEWGDFGDELLEVIEYEQRLAHLRPERRDQCLAGLLGHLEGLRDRRED